MASDSMIFYRSFYESAMNLQKKDRILLYDAIFSYQFDDAVPSLPPNANMLWLLIKPQIDSNLRRRENGKLGKSFGNLGGRPAENNPIGDIGENPIGVICSNPIGENKITPNVNVNVNANENGTVNENENENEKKKGICPNAVSVTATKETRKESIAVKNKLDEQFALFWAAYPKKVSKSDTRKAFDRILPDAALFDKIMAALKRFKLTDEWTKENGQFVPYPATWLNKSRWEDEIITPASKYNFQIH